MGLGSFSLPLGFRVFKYLGSMGLLGLGGELKVGHSPLECLKKVGARVACYGTSGSSPAKAEVGKYSGRSLFMTVKA